ncbi:MAG: PBP1A family penicillin-binding protein [Sphingobium sp.]|nr:PBP1A family penicillin-binding protein [Sphingobium sp.]
MTPEYPDRNFPDPDLSPVAEGASTTTGDVRPTADPDRAKARRRRLWRGIAWGVSIFILLFWITVGWLAITAPLSKSLRPIAPPSLTLRASDGSMIARRGASVDDPVDVTKLPKHVGQAFVAIEDRRFYGHWGVDPRGIARAMWHNATTSGSSQGGSTITQQLAKLVFLNSDRTLGRKAREALVAMWIEAWLTKDEILSRYLSTVYFGDNVYGLRAAARHYFDKRPEDLKVGEAAMLAGLMKAPSRLAPSHNLDGARARQALVVQAMKEEGFISADTATRVRPAKLHLVAVQSETRSTYFADWIMPAARQSTDDAYGPEEVKTTLDARLQKLAEHSVARAGSGLQVALVAMKPDGSVVAMVGGQRYADSHFNRATQARRQPGSTFKLFVYLAALRAGMRPDDKVEDKPLTIGNWSPANAGGRYRGEITLKQAFAQSSNVAAVRIAQQVGIDAVIRAARDLGVQSALGNDPSLALGTSGITLVELCQAYAAVASGHYPVRAHGLPEEEKGWLDGWWNGPKSLSGDEEDGLKEMLAAVVDSGTGRGAALETDVFGKTGTSQDNRDALFVGFAGGLVTAVWVGRDDNKPVPGLAGGGMPARIWRSFMSGALGVEPKGAKVPVTVDPDVGNMSDILDAVSNGVTIGIDAANDGISAIRQEMRARREEDVPPPAEPAQPETEPAPPPD